MFHNYWNEAEVATELQRHDALLKVLRFKCECVRMAKVSYALSKYHLLPENITTIAQFLGVHMMDQCFVNHSNHIK